MDAQVRANAQKFLEEMPGTVSANIAETRAHSDDKFLDAYASTTTLQAWRSTILEDSIEDGPLGFFLEAQSDLSMSLVLVQAGMWRSAMKSLRSVIENTIRFAYYMDHCVEYELWERGEHRPTFQSFFSYLKDHPRLVGEASKISSVDEFEKSYRNLSNVVHASSTDLRTTTQSSVIMLWKKDKASIGKWATEFRRVVLAANLIMLCLFASHLQGAKHLGLRQAISKIVPASTKPKIKAAININIPK